MKTTLMQIIVGALAALTFAGIAVLAFVETVVCGKAVLADSGLDREGDL